MTFRDYVNLMRPWQWYKNLLVFLAIIFVGIPKQWPWETLPAIFRWNYYPPLIIGFLVFCAVSSAGYILNDIADLEKDAAHPEKKNRPLPSGSASVHFARLLAGVLLIVGLVVGYILDPVFFILVILYIINSQLYNRYLRNWAIVDVITIAVGFIIRAIAGTFLIDVPFTSWLVIGVFFFALVLGFGKRKNELQLLGGDAELHKPVFRQYTEAMLDQGIVMSATWVVFFYTIYCYENFKDVMQAQPILLTVPIAAGLILRYVYLIQSGSPVGRKPHKAFKDKGIFLGAMLFGLVLLWTLFFWQPVFQFFYELFPPLFPPTP
ncbi:MAG: UbiA prenyltransferase family protein [Candidatus Thorarchaeota archaeon]|nr:UbiA prenyltransferase family protein [Candidatus Thorarchaeota archaeon]